MKIKNTIISLILLITSCVCLSACGNTNNGERNSKAWFTNTELSDYGLSDLAQPTVLNLNTQISSDNEKLLYAQGIVKNQQTFELYVLSVINFVTQNYANTSGYKDSVNSGTATYTCHKVTNSSNLVNYSVRNSNANIYEIYYTNSTLSTDTVFAIYNSNVTKIKLWNAQSTYCLRLCYYANNYENFTPNTITLTLVKPNENVSRFYSLFDGAVA